MALDTTGSQFTVEELHNRAALDDALGNIGLTRQQVMDRPQDLFEKLEAGILGPGEMDNLAQMMGTIGNDNMARIMMANIRVHGGDSTLLAGFGEMINQAFQARTGSITFSAGGRVSNVVDPLAPGDAAAVMIQKAYVELSDTVPADQLNAAMGVDDLAAVSALGALAQEAGLKDLSMDLGQIGASFAQEQHFAATDAEPDMAELAPNTAATPATPKMG